MPRVLVTDEVHEKLIRSLEDMGFECNYSPDITNDEVYNIISDYEGIIISTKIKVNKELLDKAPKLRFIGRAGSGLDNIDVRYAEDKGVKVINSPEGNREAVAEHALGLLLALLRNIVKSDHEVRAYKWEREANRGAQLSGKTVGIIGFGNTGKAFAQKLSALGVNVIAYDKYVKQFNCKSVNEVDLEDIFLNADIVSLHIPLTEETHYLVNSEFIGQFKKPVYIINTSRGKIINLADLLNEFHNNNLAGAALDVIENEKIGELTVKEQEIFENLIKQRRVIITPHIAGWTFESRKQIAEVLADKLKTQLG